MTPNSNRAALLQRLALSPEPWAGDIYWDERVNRRLLAWIGERFITPVHRTLSLSRCKAQLPAIWEAFTAFLSRRRRLLDLRDIDPELLADFEKALPRLGWSRSAVHLIELLLLAARRYLHEQKILYGRFSGTFKRSPLAPVFPVSVQDFRIIRSRYIEQANDYEICFFDLITSHSVLRQSLIHLTGADIDFEYRHGFITVDKTAFPLPEAISTRLLKLIRSRDILSEEGLFEAVGPLWRPFCKKVAAICMAHNIPAYAPEAIWGFLTTYLWHLHRLGVYGSDEIGPIWLPEAGTPPSLANLKILDRVYRQITIGKKFLSHQLPYQPHPMLVALDSCRRLCSDDRINAPG